MSHNFRFTDESELQAFARRLANALSAGSCVLLRGTLGAGKTSFARAFIRAKVGNDELEVPSPTFLIVQEYDAQDKTRIYHCDFYRLKDSQDLLELGIDEWAGRETMLVEWPDAVAYSWPDDRVEIEITPDAQDENARELIITTHGAKAQELEGFLQLRERWSEFHDHT